MKTDIVCTTIGDGSFLKHYAREILDAGAQDSTRIIVISDHKTDHKAMNAAVVEAWDQGIDVLCPSLTEQVTFMQSLGEPDMFPWNSDGRRNIGYLMAWRDKADVMITIDDDNLPTQGWLAGHQVVTAPAARYGMVSSPSGFWNPCGLMRFSTRLPVWPRGYPYGKRSFPAVTGRVTAAGEVAINGGLWTGDPDVDAITRLAMHPHADEVLASAVLAAGTFAPVNSQNTAVRRDVLPAYCYFEKTKRFADIWQGYFAQACAQHMGHHVRFGTPVADCGIRNDHGILNDLALEYDGIMMADQVLEWLTQVKLSGSTYAETYDSLRHELAEFTGCATLTPHQRGLLQSVAARMRQWLQVTERLS